MATDIPQLAQAEETIRHLKKMIQELEQDKEQGVRIARRDRQTVR